MLKAFGFCIKFFVFSILVLVLGNWLRWDGKTISDQVKLKMSHPEQSEILGTVKTWADQVTQDARKGLKKKVDQASAEEEIPSSERQKLKALIRELNSTHEKD